MWKQLVVGVGVTRYSASRRRRRSTAQLPHPFFDNTVPHVEGTTPATTRSEVGAHVLIGWMLPITDRVRVLLTAGPSYLNVQASRS